MRKVFHQPYDGKKYISCYVGKPPKDIFEGDVIRIDHKFDGSNACWYMTPDEASCFIRAVSAGLHHYLVSNDKLAKLKKGDL